ncbi:hypothetical protein V6Z11_D06G102000 [Gossypium hirsutum]
MHQRADLALRFTTKPKHFIDLKQSPFEKCKASRSIIDIFHKENSSVFLYRSFFSLTGNEHGLDIFLNKNKHRRDSTLSPSIKTFHSLLSYVSFNSGEKKERKM